MRDVDKTIQNEFRETHGLGAEGVILGCKMFDEFRAGIIASLPEDLSAEEFKRELFRRIYGASMEDFLSGAATDAELDR